MTYAPSCLLNDRALIQRHTGLSPVSIGIVGNTSHVGGYHCGSDRVVPDDYSVFESPRDKAGLTNAACAIDVDFWTKVINGVKFDLRHMSNWIVAQCKANTIDSLDIREVIYSPDGHTVKRWDRLGVRSTGGVSHLGHTHLSVFRDAIKAGRSLHSLLERYFAEIGSDEMQLSDVVHLRTGGVVKYSDKTTTVEGVLTSTNYYVLMARDMLAAAAAADEVRDSAMLAAIQALTTGTPVEAAPIVEAIRAEAERTRGVVERLLTQLGQVEKELEDARAESTQLRARLADALSSPPPMPGTNA